MCLALLLLFIPLRLLSASDEDYATAFEALEIYNGVIDEVNNNWHGGMVDFCNVIKGGKPDITVRLYVKNFSSEEKKKEWTKKQNRVITDQMKKYNKKFKYVLKEVFGSSKGNMLHKNFFNQYC